MRIGVVGIGNMGRHHVRVYTVIDEAELAGVYDLNSKVAEDISQTYSITAYHNLSELLDKVEAISICVPTASHKEVALEAISKGVHVLIEKPISLSLDEADEIIKTAKKRNVTLMVGHVERFNPVVNTVKQIVSKDKIVYLETRRTGSYPSTPPKESVVLDLMIHDIDVVLSFVESRVKKTASMLLKRRSKKEDFVQAQLIFENGIAAVLTASRLTQKKVRELDIITEKAHITVDYMTQEVLIRTGLSAEYVDELTNGELGKSVRYRQVSAIEIPYIHKGEPLQFELEHFIDCARSNKTPVVSGEDSKKALQVALDILASSL